MATVINIQGTRYTYETEANAGVNLRTGERWFGTLIKYRPGTVGRWRRVNAVDIHPFDSEAIEAMLTAYVKGNVKWSDR